MAPQWVASRSQPRLSGHALETEPGAPAVGALAHTVCTATALNNQDVAVGNRTGVGVIWRNGQVQSLTKLLDAKARAAGWMISYPTAINDSGAIVVQARSRQDPQHRVFQAVFKPVVTRPTGFD